MVFGWLSNSNAAFSYKERIPFERRKSEGTKARERRPDLVPVILEKGHREQIGDLPNHKFLVPCDMTLADFQLLIRKRIRLSEENALFLFIRGNTLISMSHTMKSIYEQYHEDDFFLYMTYGQENTFG